MSEDYCVCGWPVRFHFDAANRKISCEAARRVAILDAAEQLQRIHAKVRAGLRLVVSHPTKAR